DLAIAEMLAAADPSNTEWQRDLSVSLNKVGEALSAQGDLPGALASFKKSAERLAAADSSNSVWQHDLWGSYARMAKTAKRAGATDAHSWQKKANAQLAAMKRRGLQLSAEEEESLRNLPQ
ncbi:MAG: tetratricopeptide repeat-containing protein, partial [Deltaproteobacteria bacterium]|nr:tetratricopeptide repeat-containing protein [Deltaproteobacteria bacterium]